MATVTTQTSLTKTAFLNLQYPMDAKVYRVAGQDAISITLSQGDQVDIESQDGQQDCEIIVLDKKGHIAPELLTTQNVVTASKTALQLEESSNASAALQARFNSWGVNHQHLQQALYYSADSLPSFKIEHTLTLIIIAAGNKMSAHDQDLATELNITVVHKEPQFEHLPEPLAPPVEEIRIPHSSARTYEVKAGEWIQIIDVAGKQCSDFLAFDKAALEEQQVLKGLDPTATRTITGISTPEPGLYSRFLDSDMQTMVELVQDTVGRHDSFLMACTPKYYEDSGHFGHISCTENFNNALSIYGIEPRAAWPAVNFFFNTTVLPCSTVAVDEPWSRPGDYVLLRATRDLICASSACPDDIDPANGWVPTDIQVRIYGAEHNFPRANAYRTSAQELPRMTKNTGFHSRTSALTQRFTEYRGYWVATEYEGWGAKAEYLACRERVAMIDLSPLRKFEVNGPDAEELMQYAITRNVRRLAVGQIVYSAICQETGGMIDDGTLFRMGEQSFRWICGDPYTGIWLKDVAEKKGYRVSIRNSTEQLHNVAVQGPNSRDLLAKIIWSPESQPDVENLAWFHLMIGRLNGPKGIPLMISRTGYTGELGFEVWCHPDDANTLWDAIWEAGQEYNIAPLGFDALDMLRIEAGLIFADHEFCPETNPFEAGIGFTVPLKSKEDDFIGREAIVKQNPESRHKLVGVILDGPEPTSHGEQVYQGRYPVGVITSTTFSPILRKQIALCRVAPEFAQTGTRIEVGQLDGHQKRLAGEVVPLPFYDPERSRVRS